MKRFIIIILPIFLLTACTRALATAPLLLSTSTPQFLSTPTQTLPLPTNTLLPIFTDSPTASETPPATPAPIETPTPSAPPLLTLLFTGQMNIPCDLSTPTLFSELTDYLQLADFVIGALTTPQLECLANVADALAEAGFDGVSTCLGEACAPLETALAQTGVRVIDGGQPVIAEIQGIRFGFVGLGGETLPEENLRADIATAREAADVVVVLPAWGADSDPFPDADQLALAQVAASAGADLIVGENAQIQAFGKTEGVPVFYGLGTLSGIEEEAEGLLVRVYFRGTEYLGYEIFPTFTEDGVVHLADEAETAAILERLQAVNDQLP